MVELKHFILFVDSDDSRLSHFLCYWFHAVDCDNEMLPTYQNISFNQRS